MKVFPIYWVALLSLTCAASRQARISRWPTPSLITGRPLPPTVTLTMFLRRLGPLKLREVVAGGGADSNAHLPWSSSYLPVSRAVVDSHFAALQVKPVGGNPDNRSDGQIFESLQFPPKLFWNL